MKQAIILIGLCMLLIAGCNEKSNKGANQEQKTWCTAQSGVVIVNGHITPLTNTKFNRTIEGCCCMGIDEFICVCPDTPEEISFKFFNK